MVTLLRQALARPGGERSSQWRSVRDRYAASHPLCAFCGSAAVDVHHIQPFHLFPTRELDPNNLVSLCRVHHFIYGHAGDWKAYNPDVLVDSEFWKAVKATQKVQGAGQRKDFSLSGTAWRFEIAGDPNPVLHRNSFDYDGASIPPLMRALARDKMDRRWIVPSDGHDLGYCIHGYVTGFTKADWDRFLLEVGEAYGDNAYQCAKYRLAVAAGGWAAWDKPREEIDIYTQLVRIERVAL